MYLRRDIGAATRRMNFGVFEWVKCGTLRWFGHMVKMNMNSMRARWREMVSMKAPKNGSVKWMSFYRVGSHGIRCSQREFCNKKLETSIIVTPFGDIYQI